MYSQNKEEAIIVDYFDNHPSAYARLLDIGAYDGKTFSNTFRLLELGWSGVLLDGSPQVFVALQRNTAGAKVELVNACITTQHESLIDFYDNGGAVATPNLENYDKWKNSAEFNKIHVMSMHYTRLIEKFGTAFDFVNIDVEGGSTELFTSLYGLMPDVMCWCVEHDGNIAAILKKATNHREVYRNGENIILVK